MDPDDYEQPTSRALLRLEAIARHAREWRWSDRAQRRIGHHIADERHALDEAAWEAAEARRGRHYSGLPFSGPI